MSSDATSVSTEADDRDREVGRTRDVGYEIGVSRTVDHPLHEVWELITSPAGAAVWLAPGAVLGTSKGDAYVAVDGTTGELRSRHDHDRVRVTYQPPGRSEPTTVQVVVRPAAAAGRTSVRFHQERLEDGEERTVQREHWRGVLDRLEQALREAHS